jgi:hypothetical protein
VVPFLGCGFVVGVVGRSPSIKHITNPQQLYSNILLSRHRHVSLIALRLNQSIVHGQNVLYQSFSDRCLSIVTLSNVTGYPPVEANGIGSSFDIDFALIKL